jgi:hypothetical protein
MRFLRHPGPPAPERENAVPCRASRFSLRLAAGQSVNAAVTAGLAEAGFTSGYVHLEGVAVSPMRYVIQRPIPPMPLGTATPARRTASSPSSGPA